MSENAERLTRRTRPQLYWIFIAFFLIVTAILMVTHWVTGTTPDRVAVHIPALNFDIYWYGVWITGGMALGAFLVSRLMREQGTAVFHDVVPPATRRIPITDLALPGEIGQILHESGVETVGELLLQWGFDRRTLGLNEKGLQTVSAALQEETNVDRTLLHNPPWRVWNPDHIWNGMVWVLILGVIGARLYHVLTPSPSLAAVGINSPLDYFRNPYKIIDLRSGGLGIFGGIAGGALGMWLYTRRQRMPMLPLADYSVIGLALGQAVGRWGNFFNQELYGRPTDLPWAITIDPAYRLPAYSDFARFHPAFLYESLWSLLTFFLLITLLRRYRHRLLPGDLMALYLICYAIGRTLLEMVRLDSRTLSLGSLDLNIAVATVVSLFIAVAMAAWAGARRFRLGIDERE